MSKASSDPPADLEKGLKVAAIDEEEDVMVGAHTLFCVGAIAWTVKNSHNWWDQWQCILFISAMVIYTLLITPKLKNGLVRKYATKPTPASDCDVSAKLLS
ncbi:unnamed protein product [Urochloa humidicola]